MDGGTLNLGMPRTPALEMAAACGFDVDGDDGAATPSVSRKGTPTEAGAKFQEVRLLPAKEVHTDRCMAIALTPQASPRLAVAIHLRVIEGGAGRHPREEGDKCLPAFATEPWR